MQVGFSRLAANSGQKPGNRARSFTVSGDINDPLAQSLRIAMLARGMTPAVVAKTGQGVMMRRQGGRSVRLTEPQDLRHAAGDLHWLPAIPVLANRLRQQLEAFSQASNARDVDLTWHALRELLSRLEAIWVDPSLPEAVAPTHADVILAPLLWRIRVLDAVHGTHIGDGFATLTARARALHGHAAVAQVLDRAAAQTYLDGLCGAHVVRRDDGAEWARAVGPAGHEPRLDARCRTGTGTKQFETQDLDRWHKMTQSLPNEPEALREQSFNIDRLVHDLAQARRDWRAAHDRLDEPGPRELPSPEMVAEIAENLRAILYPMRLGPADLRQEQENRYIALMLDKTLCELARQVRLELGWAARHRLRGAEAPDPSLADAIVAEFADGLSAMRRLLDTDVIAAYRGDPAARSVDEVLLCYPGVQALIWHRIAHSLHRLGVPLIARLIAERAHGQTGIDIHPGATIGQGLFIDHGTGVVIGATAIIGDRVQIYQAVTLGAKSFPQDGQGRAIKGMPRHPIVEDDVVIYSGATILGRVTIGRGSVIGGSVWVTEDVAPYTQLSQARARAVEQPGQNRRRQA